MQVVLVYIPATTDVENNDLQATEIIDLTVDMALLFSFVIIHMKAVRSNFTCT